LRFERTDGTLKGVEGMYDYWPPSLILIVLLAAVCLAAAADTLLALTVH